MGCDGGTIPKRDELVRLKKKPEQKDKEAELSSKWRHCAITQQPLQQPVAACGLGRLYSKSAVIEHLLDKVNAPDSIKHIKSLKDVKDLKLTKNPAYDADAEKTEGAIDARGSPYICPIIGIEMSGRFRFVFIWSCGCVMSERAFKEVKMRLCHLCMEPFEESDVVVINGTDEDLELMKINMATRQAKLKSKKKNKESAVSQSKNEAKPVVEEAASTSKSNGAPQETKNLSESKVSKKKSQMEDPVVEEAASTSKSNGVSQEMKNSSESKVSKKRSCMSKIEDPVYKKAKEDYSVAKDPKATDVFKSLFTSHKSDKEQKRAHWITYNPFYN